MHHLRILPVLLGSLVSLSAVEMAPLFKDHAVLQRGKTVPVWGLAEAGEPVVVRFAGQEKTATADSQGCWRVELAAMEASKEGRELTASGKTVARATDVVIGEVWLCSGQSNMEYLLAPCMGAKEDIAAADLPSLRQVKIPLIGSLSPQTTAANAAWTVCSPQTAANFTAVGFYFARAIAKEIDVPIGLISCNWGGTNIEPWIAPVGYRAVPELKDLTALVDGWDPATEAGAQAHVAFLAKLKAWMPTAEAAVAAHRPLPVMPVQPGPVGDHKQPTKLYNGMVHPLIPYALRGALWYQGESNGGEGVTYQHKMKALITGWRQLFGQGDFPFYLVQLANYQKSDPAKPEGGDGWARLREAQRATLAIANTGMAVAIDVGEAGDIHPKNKADVGLRLALWALVKDYGKQVEYSGPLYREHLVEGSTIRVRFDHAASGLMVAEKKGRDPAAETAGGKLTWFAIAGEDKVWQPAEAVIDGDSVVVSSAKIAKPVAVRYAFAMNPAGANLYNRVGLPASPFRTDNW